jgi:hypothetical protein
MLNNLVASFAHPIPTAYSWLFHYKTMTSISGDALPSGFTTFSLRVTGVAMLSFAIFAVSLVALSNVVSCGVSFKKTLEPSTNPVPVTVMT